jgi:hypothetical protein
MPPPHHGDYYSGAGMHPSPPAVALPGGHHHLPGAEVGAAGASSSAPARYDVGPGPGAGASAVGTARAASSSRGAAAEEDDEGDAGDRRGASAAAADERSADDEGDGASSDDEGAAEASVEYVLAKQYKSLRTGEHLGFPAFSSRRRLVGFYRDASGGGSSAPVGGGVRRPFKFAPFPRSVVDRDEISQQASAVLLKAMESRSDALHALRDWGSITAMVDHALVYDWSKDVPSSGDRPDGSAAAAAPGPSS